MTEETREHLSALMDGELDRDTLRFLLRRLEANAELTDCWSNFHVTRQCLRKERSFVLVNPDFANAVMLRLSRDKEVTSPSIANRFPWLRWASGGAVAASVAVFALMLSHPDDKVNSSMVTQSQPYSIAVTETAASPKSPIAELRNPIMISPIAISAASFEENRSTPGVDPRFDSYLIRYYEATNAATRAEFLPYALPITPHQPSVYSPMLASPSQQKTSTDQK